MIKSSTSSKVKRKKENKVKVVDFNANLVLRKLATQDPILGKLIKKVGKFDLQQESIESPFHALAESIVYQQLTGKAAATIFARVCALFNSSEFLCPHAVISAPDDLLRSAGLSRSKLASIKDLANKAIDGTVPESKKLRKMSDEEIIERLTTIRGIGKWTVEMILIFKLGRLDILPINDYGIRKGFATTYGHSELPKPKDLETYGERWRPYRTIASWYLWRSLELNKQ